MERAKLGLEIKAYILNPSIILNFLKQILLEGVQMVSVNFRINYGIEYEKIYDFFKDINYEHIGTKRDSIKVEEEYLKLEDFVRNTQNGRYHLQFSFGFKTSGTEKYPQLKLFLHFDFKKVRRGKEIHIADMNEYRNMNEIKKIEKKYISAGLGFLEEKDKNCAHATIGLKDKENLLKILQKEFVRYDPWKYKKEKPASQYIIALFEQENFIHIVCVFAKIVGKEHILQWGNSKNKLESILEKACGYKPVVV